MFMTSISPTFFKMCKSYVPVARLLTSGRFFAVYISSFFLVSGLQGQVQEEEEEEMVQSLILAAQPADQVLDLLEELTDKSVLRQMGLPNPPLTLNVRRPLTKSEAIIAIESLLKLNGIAILGSGEQFLKAVPLANASTQVPELLIKTTLNRPPTEKVFAALFTPEYLEPEEAMAMIRPVLSTENVVELTRANGLLVTDSLINLQRAETLLNKLDQARPVREAIRFIRIRNVPARQVAERLSQLKDGPMLRYFGNNTTFSADEATNQLLVVTDISNLDIIDELVANMDQNVEPITESHVFYIKHAQATEIVPLIETLINRQQSTDREQSLIRTRDEDGRTVTVETETTEELPLLTELASANGRISPARLQFSPFAALVADERSNSVVGYGTPSDIHFFGRIIDQIDILLPQVQIEVVIAEVTLRKGKARGIDAFGIQYNTEGDNDITFARDGQGNELPFRWGGLTLSALSVKDFSLQAVFNAAEDDSDVTVLSAPTIVTTHNKEATINVSETRPVITGTVTEGIGITTRSTVDFRDIGIELVVTPLIGNNGIIQMEIDQTVDNIVSIITGSDNPDLNGQPIIGTRRATSFLTVGDQDVIILGGLKERSENYTKRRLAVLGYIPVLGDALFTRRTLEVQDRELVIFIRPHIMESPVVASQRSARQLEESLSAEDINRLLEGREFEGVDMLRLRDGKSF